MFIAVVAVLIVGLVETPPLSSDIQALPVQYPIKGGQLNLFGPETDVIMIRPVKLSGEARETFETVFEPEGYYGAFAVGNQDGYGYAAGANTIDAAREIAVAQCETVTSGCLIVAELLPTGYLDAGPNAFTLSYEATENITAPDRGAERAMAVSEDGGYAMVWGHDSQAEAREAALADCQGQRLTFDLPIRDMPCVIVPE